LSAHRAADHAGHGRDPGAAGAGELCDEQGDLENAAVYYAQFVDLWSEADPDVQPRVETACARLQDIVRERG
jgi:hypothetical protein